MTRRLLLSLLMLTVAVHAQRRVDPRNTYHRVITVVPLVGQGTAADPKRPQYAPSPATTAGAQPGSGPGATPATSGTTGIPVAAAPAIIGYMHVVSDDGKYALVEYVAKDMAAFKAILSDSSLTVFVKGKDSKAAIETALQKFKRSFSLDQFGLVMP